MATSACSCGLLLLPLLQFSTTTRRSLPGLSFALSAPHRRVVISFARRQRRRNSSTEAVTQVAVPKKKVTVVNEEGDSEDEMIDVEDDDIDAFEALFDQLEEDLRNDGASLDDSDDEITPEDMDKLEKELAEAFGELNVDDELLEDSPSSTDDLNPDDEIDETPSAPKLKSWQIRRLARALKVGRRKAGIKNLAAELGLERSLVLELLRDPPPNLLLLSASLRDEVIELPPEPEPKTIEYTGVMDPRSIPEESKPGVKLPVHVMQTKWSAKKRLKKVHVDTLERVYARTKRPTDAMISSIVHVTNLPWKRVVKWFEDKRLHDGVPDQRVPFRRSTPETAATS